MAIRSVGVRATNVEVGPRLVDGLGRRVVGWLGHARPPSFRTAHRPVAAARLCTTPGRTPPVDASRSSGRSGVGGAWHDHEVRSEPTILHVDLDAFFAAVEQRDKPSLRGKPVVVGGVGGRGVVATASYEARTFGVHSAMSTAEARRRCPNAAFLSGRFHAYRDTSRAVMELLRSTSPLVEPLSLDEAFVDLEGADLPDLSVTTVSAFARQLKERVHEVTGGLTGSVGIGTSKLVAKIASDLDKPDGLVVVAPGMEQDLLRPMQVTVIPGSRSRHRRAAAPRRRAHRRGARAPHRGRAGPPARSLSRLGSLCASPGPGTTGGGAGAGDEVSQR